MFVRRTRGRCSIPTRTATSKGIKEQYTTIEVCAIVRRLQRIVVWVVADLSWNTKRSALLYFNRFLFRSSGIKLSEYRLPVGNYLILTQ